MRAGSTLMWHQPARNGGFEVLCSRCGVIGSCWWAYQAWDMKAEHICEANRDAQIDGSDRTNNHEENQ